MRTAHLCLVVILALASTAQAQTTADEAQILFDAGVEAYDANRPDEALRHFMQSNRISPNPSVAVNIGHAFVVLKRYPEAYRWYRQGLQMGAAPSDVDWFLDNLRDKVAILEIVTDPPGARVYLDRENLGSIGISPTTIAVEPGPHRIILGLEGYRSFTSEEIAMDRVGEPQSFRHTLEPITSTVIFEGDAGAEVRLGSEDAPVLCTTPCAVEVPVGSRLLYFTGQGYRSLPTIADVVEDKITTVRADLIPLTGAFRVDADERSAVVEIDGVRVGTTPVYLSNLQAGAHELLISKRGFASIRRQVEVIKDETLDLGTVRLEREVTVESASRSTERIEDAPGSISLITREEIELFGYQTVGEAVRGLRGLQLLDQTGGRQSSIRGTTKFQQVKITLDNLGVSSPVLGAATLEMSDFAYVDDFESIELNRGAGSLLYGTGAMSGLIALRRPDRDDVPSGLQGEASLGTFGSIGKVRGRVSAGDRDLGGYVGAAGVRNQGRELLLEDVELAEGPQDVLVPNFLDSSSFTTYGMGWAKDLTFRFHVMEAFDGHVNTGAAGSDPLNPNNRISRGYAFLDLGFEPDVGEAVDLQFRVAYLTTRFDVFVEQDAGIFDLDLDQVSRWTTFEGRSILRLVPDRLTVSLGGEYVQSLGSSGVQKLVDKQGVFAALGVPESATDPLLRDDPRILSGYLVGDLRPIDRLRLHAGVRVDAWSVVLNPEDVGVLAQPEPQITPNLRVAAIFDPTDDDVFKATGYTGFRNPDTYERRAVNVLPQDVGLNELSPESVVGGEIEWRRELGARWSALTSIWGNKYSDLVSTINSGQVGELAELTTVANAGGKNVYGWDLEVARELKGGWMFNGWYTYQRALDEVLNVDALGDGRPLTDGEYADTVGIGRNRLGLRVVAPLGDTMHLATRVVGADGRYRPDGVKTDPALLTDFVVSGWVGRRAVRWQVGVYNAMNAQLDFVQTDLTTVTYAGYGRRFLAMVTYAGPGPK